MSNEQLNDFLLADGDNTRQEAESNGRKKTTYVRLKDGESLRGFLLTDSFKMYQAHNDYEKRIKTHTCKNPKNNPELSCLSCTYGVKRTKKAIVPFYNIDTNQVEIFDASKRALKVIYAFVDEYEEEAITTPISLTRSGSDSKTTYSLQAARVKAAEREVFVKPEGILLDNEFYMNALNIPDNEYIKKLIGLESDEDAKPMTK
jgi:hypothetical protein